MNKPIVKASLKFNCRVIWEDMSNTAGGKKCDRCERKVYDLRNSGSDELEIILRENNYRICARFNQEQLITPSTNISAWKKWLSAAMVLIGFNLVNGKVIAQNQQIKTNSIGPHTTTVGEVVIAVDTPPIFYGGEKNLKKFLKMNVNYKGTKGKVIVNFNIDTNGRVENATIFKKLDPMSDQEALRIVNLLSNWQPAKYHNKNIVYPYTLSIAFTK